MPAVTFPSTNMRNSLIVPCSWAAPCFRFATDNFGNLLGVGASPNDSAVQNGNIRDLGTTYSLRSLEPATLSLSTYAFRLPRNTGKRRIRGIRTQIDRSLTDVGNISAGTTNVQIWQEMPMLRCQIKARGEVTNNNAIINATDPILRFGLSDAWQHVDLAVPDTLDNLYVTAQELGGFTTGQMEATSGNWISRDNSTREHAGTGMLTVTVLVEFAE